MSVVDVNGWCNVVKKPIINNVGETVVANVLVAHNEYYGKGDTRKEISSFFTLELWDTAADYIMDHCEVGDTISFKGSLREDRWEQEGERRSKVFVRVNKFQIFKKNRNVE